MNTYDPYEELSRPRTGPFSGLPSAEPGTVLVVDREGHPLRTLRTHDDRLTAGETRFGRIRTLYRVDDGDHPLEFLETFPCQDDPGGFQARVRMSVRVVSPESVVRRKLHDVAAVLVPALSATIRKACWGYQAEQHAKAEQHALEAVREIEDGPGHDPAFTVSHFFIELTLSESAARFVTQLKEHERGGALQHGQARLAAELEQERDKLEAERAGLAREYERQHWDIQKERQAAEADLEAQRLKLAMDRARLEAELQREAVRVQIELQNLKLDNYENMLRRGEFGILALELLDDPTAIGRLGQRMAEQRQLVAHQQIEALRLLLANDAIEGWQITDKAKGVLSQLLDAWSGNTPAIGGVSTGMIADSTDGAGNPEGSGASGRPGGSDDQQIVLPPDPDTESVAAEGGGTDGADPAGSTPAYDPDRD